jgi:hypothetical protein
MKRDKTKDTQENQGVGFQQSQGLTADHGRKKANQTEDTNPSEEIEIEIER